MIVTCLGCGHSYRTDVADTATACPSCQKDWGGFIEEREMDAWEYGEERIDRIAQSDASGDHYAQCRSKYHREIKPGVWVDVYSVLVAFGVTNPADAHAIKKMLMPGQRGAKDAIQDRREAIASLERAIEIEQEGE